jgi:hypothetical protein
MAGSRVSPASFFHLAQTARPGGRRREGAEARVVSPRSLEAPSFRLRSLPSRSSAISPSVSSSRLLRRSPALPPHSNAQNTMGQPTYPPPPPQYQQPLAQPPMVSLAGAPPHLVGQGQGREWSTGLCDCGSDCGGFCLSCWCPCLSYGRSSFSLFSPPAFLSSLSYEPTSITTTNRIQAASRRLAKREGHARRRSRYAVAIFLLFLFLGD